ncbi:hypothetical protein DAT35_37125 [Vitiosangium sp. GDMCC 1.1324]|nr:hypothetical protein DAT35_37125 [Vitiosangium sp. GDMCC 1.1324]
MHERLVMQTPQMATQRRSRGAAQLENEEDERDENPSAQRAAQPCAYPARLNKTGGHAAPLL